MQLSLSPTETRDSAGTSRDVGEGILRVGVDDALALLAKALPGSQAATAAQQAATRSREHQRALATSLTEYATRLDQVAASFTAFDAASSQALGPLLPRAIGSW